MNISVIVPVEEEIRNKTGAEDIQPSIDRWCLFV